MSYALNLCNVLCQLCLNKTSGEVKKEIPRPSLNYQIALVSQVTFWKPGPHVWSKRLLFQEDVPCFHVVIIYLSHFFIHLLYMVWALGRQSNLNKTPSQGAHPILGEADINKHHKFWESQRNWESLLKWGLKSCIFCKSLIQEKCKIQV